jgi:hypothetical protein
MAAVVGEVACFVAYPDVKDKATAVWAAAGSALKLKEFPGSALKLKVRRGKPFLALELNRPPPWLGQHGAPPLRQPLINGPAISHS